MRKKINRVLFIICALILIVWVIGFLGYWGITHTMLVMGLILAALVTVFIGLITVDDFL